MSNPSDDLNHGPLPGVDPSGSAQPPVIMSIEELRAHIHEIHDTSIGSDDPVLILYTLHHVFMDEYEYMLQRHNQAITSIIGTAIKGLTSEAMAENLKHQVRLADRTHVLFERQYKRAKLLSALNIGAAFVCALVVVYLVSN